MVQCYRAVIENVLILSVFNMAASLRNRESDDRVVSPPRRTIGCDLPCPPVGTIYPQRSLCTVGKIVDDTFHPANDLLVLCPLGSGINTSGPQLPV